MMLTRAWRADIDLSDSEGRIISGIAVPYNSPTTIAERGMVFDETFLPGSMRDTIHKRGDRVRLLGFHDAHTWPIGKPTELKDTARGAEFVARVSDTQAGNEALTLIRDGALDGVSVGFSVPDGGDTWTDDRSQRNITRADLHEFSLVNFPAYDRARVESVRAMSMEDPVDAHGYDDAAGVCVACGKPEGDGNHTTTAAAVPDFALRYELEIARLQLLRLQYI